MRYERDNSLSVAAAHVSATTRALPEYAEARAEVVTKAEEQLLTTGHDVATLRALGGLSVILLRHIGALAARFKTDIGSKFFPTSFACELAAPAALEEMRFELQRRLTRHREMIK